MARIFTPDRLQPEVYGMAAIWANRNVAARTGLMCSICQRRPYKRLTRTSFPKPIFSKVRLQRRQCQSELHGKKRIGHLRGILVNLDLHAGQ